MHLSFLFGQKAGILLSVTSGLNRKSFKIFEFFVWTSNVYDVCSVYYAEYGTGIRLKIGQSIIEISGSKMFPETVVPRSTF